MTQQDAINELRRMLPTEDILCQLAEECSELAQAALKLRRTMSVTNPARKTRAEAFDALIEETADVLVCLRTLQATADNGYCIDVLIAEKMERWRNHLKEAQV